MKDEKGITLIALVVTIIILLILAGVTIAFVSGENGLLKQAKTAINKTEESQKNEIGLLEGYDKYIKDVLAEDKNAAFENNGIDKSHDGAKYDSVTTDDGMWTIYKDIDTKTTKVNVYVESKYYCPSFEQFVLEKSLLVSFLGKYSLPIYSFSDLSDFYADLIFTESKMSALQGGEEVINETEYMKQRRERMGVGPFFSEILEQLGIDEYDAYEEVGKDLVEEIKNVDISGYKGVRIPENQMMIPEIKIPAGNWGITYENLLSLYNKLYGEKAKLVIPEEEKSKKYKIELPDGKVEEITGENLYKAKFRYVTTENGDIQIKITKDENIEEEIVYKGVTNIGECLINDGNYTYTYNCLPFLDDGGLGIIESYLLDEAIKQGADLSQEFDISSIDFSNLDDKFIIYRFNLGGWNAALKDANLNLIEFHNEITINEPCKTSINGEPVTSMIATYYGSTINFEPITIPNTVKYMFDTFRSSNMPENLTEIILPKSVEYASYVDAYFYTHEIVFKIPRSIKSFEGSTIEYIEEYIKTYYDDVEIYD